MKNEWKGFKKEQKQIKKVQKKNLGNNSTVILNISMLFILYYYFLVLIELKNYYMY